MRRAAPISSPAKASRRVHAVARALRDRAGVRTSGFRRDTTLATREDIMRQPHPNTFARIPTSIPTIGMLLVLGLIAGAAPAQAQMDAEVRLGFYTDPDAVSFGGGLITPLTTAEPWMFNPNVEVAIGDFVNVISINPDFHYDFPTGSSMAYWMGAGPAVMFVDRDRGDTDTDFGVNLLAGLGAKHGATRPFVQFKGVISDNSRLALTGGLRF